jgi:hypothetical protein
VEPVGRISASASAKSMEQKEAEQWAAAVDFQPTTSKPDRLLDQYQIAAVDELFFIDIA